MKWLDLFQLPIPGGYDLRCIRLSVYMYFYFKEEIMSRFLIISISLPFSKIQEVCFSINSYILSQSTGLEINFYINLHNETKQ